MFDHMFNGSGMKFLYLIGGLVVALIVFEGIVSLHDRRVCEKAGGVQTSIGCVDGSIFKAR